MEFKLGMLCHASRAEYDSSWFLTSYRLEADNNGLASIFWLFIKDANSALVMVKRILQQPRQKSPEHR